MTRKLVVQQLGLQEYQPVWDEMRAFTQQRDENTHDELWLVEHPPVFTQGLAGKAEHLLNPQQIPVIQTDRGGQVTYHGPGQLVAYPLLDLNRRGLTIRQLVTHLEKCIIDLLAECDIPAKAKCDAPGVYTEKGKIASIGLRVRKGCCYHGIALNVAMDLSPFQAINPCGFKGLAMAQIQDYHPKIRLADINPRFIAAFRRQFGYTGREELNDEQTTTV